MTIRRKIILTVVLMLCIVLVAVVSQPWKQRAEERLRQALEARGFRHVVVEVTSLQPNAARLSHFALGDIIQAEDIAVDIRALEGAGLRGAWKVARLHLQGLPEAMTPLMAEGEFSVSTSMFSTTIHATAPDGRLQMEAELQLPRDRPEDSTLAIRQFVMKPHGGTWTLAPTTLRLAAAEVWPLQMQVKQQPIAALLAAFGQTSLSATGEVEGMIPLEVNRKEATLTFKNAALESTAAGVMVLAPEALPAEGAEVGLLRDLMADFHFSKLSIAMSGVASGGAQGVGEKLGIHLRLEGNNPAVYDGKPVHLNINLKGDLVSLLQQSLLPMLEPARWIHEDAK